MRGAPTERAARACRYPSAAPANGISSRPRIPNNEVIGWPGPGPGPTGNAGRPISVTRSPAAGGGVTGAGTGATAGSAAASATGTGEGRGGGAERVSGARAAGVGWGATAGVGTVGAAGRSPEPPVLTSSAVRAVLAVRTVRAPSAMVTDGRLESLDDELSASVLRATSWPALRAPSPRESLLEEALLEPSPPRRPDSSRRSDCSECDARSPGSAVATAPGPVTSTNATVAPATAATTRLH